MKGPVNDWPKKETMWIYSRTLYVSIPFTWRLPAVRNILVQRSFEWDTAVLGGPAVYLMPTFFHDLDFVRIGKYLPAAITHINPYATKTTSGCIRRCKFCAVPILEGKFKELKKWKVAPVLIDNNLLASSVEHFDRVIDSLKQFDVVDFNQGLDSRLLTSHHAERFKELSNPIIRLALDSMAYVEQWEIAMDILFTAGIAKNKVRSYALAGFDSDPEEAWARCQYIEGKGIKVLPMWFHELDTLDHGIVTEKQEALGWNDYERRRIMQWFYQHKKAVNN